MRQAGRYLPEYKLLRAKAGSFMKACLTPSIAAEITLQPIHRFDLDAAIIFSDILMVPYGLGIDVNVLEGEGPVLSPTNLQRLPEFNLDSFLDRAAPIFEALRLVRQQLSSDKALIGFVGGPWTVACYMVAGRGGKNITDARALAYQYPEQMDALIETLVEATCVYLSAQIDAGANAIQLFDSWAGELPEPYFQRWVVQPLQQVVAHVRQNHADIPVVIFPRGGQQFYPLFFPKKAPAQIVPHGVNIDTNANVEWILKMVPKTCAIQGGLDPQLLVAGGKPMLQDAERLLMAFKGRPYVFNLGHGIVPNTPPEHVQDLVTFVRSFNG
jgi:uroporphyrinogen decarboxylase